MRFLDSKTLDKLIKLQSCIKNVAEVNVCYTVFERKKINILREKLIDSINSIALTNPLLASHYSNFYHSLSKNEKKIASLQLIQEKILSIENIKVDRLTKIKNMSSMLEERKYSDKNNEENIEQRILFDAVSRKFMSL
ncbi:hypothetical protein [Candidatus Liberibacter brunswickensis]|uniref:hypothetical protein n=1 Tax=Candidatus Liberibacter brunswickensis TaxID=1968796 RepID=UPI002FE3DC50